MKHLILVFTFFVVTVQDTGRKMAIHSSDVKYATEATRCGSGTFLVMTNYKTFCVTESVQDIYTQVK